MLETKFLEGRTVAISISESADLAVLGFKEIHLADAFVELCRHLLADGASLLYGGDLRVGGYTQLLFELIERYRPEATSELPAFKNVLPWPVHMSISDEALEKRRGELPRATVITCLSRDGEVVREIGDGPFLPQVPDEADWIEGLTKMRLVTAQISDIRILVGGRTDQFKGRSPGIAEEALSTLHARKALFLIGGFGGCTGDICGALGLWPGRRRGDWPGLAHFGSEQFNLRNGLEAEENRLLAQTPHIDEAIALVLRGVTRIFSGS